MKAAAAAAGPTTPAPCASKACVGRSSPASCAPASGSCRTTSPAARRQRRPGSRSAAGPRAGGTGHLPAAPRLLRHRASQRGPGGDLRAPPGARGTRRARGAAGARRGGPSSESRWRRETASTRPSEPTLRASSRPTAVSLRDLRVARPAAHDPGDPPAVGLNGGLPGALLQLARRAARRSLRPTTASSTPFGHATLTGWSPSSTSTANARSRSLTGIFSRTA